jgi:hypothetical protein
MKNRVTKFIFIGTLFLISSCFKKEDYDHVNPADLVTFDEHPQIAKADGSNAVTISVTLNDKIDLSKRIVILKTTLGTFASGKGDSIVLNTNDGFKLSAQLMSTKKGTANVTARISNYSVKDSRAVTFDRVFPMSITTSVDSFAVRANYKSEILITATMKSTEGIPSQGQLVKFSAYTSQGAPIGAFLNGINSASSDANGKAVMRYTAGTTTYRGEIKLKSETEKEDGSVIEANTTIYLTD